MMPDFRPFDYARATGAGTQNALAMMQTMGASRSLRDDNMMRQLSQQAAETGEDLPNLLDQAGMSKQAMVMREQQLGQKIKGLQYLSTASKMVRDQKTYDLFRRTAEDNQIAAPGELPDIYDKALIDGIAGRVPADLKIITQNLPKGMAQQYKKEGNKLTEWGEPFARWTPKQREKGKGKGVGRELKASDENAIARQAGNLFGGMYDPVSGRFSGLKGVDSEKTVQLIIERATELFRDGKLTRAGAVSQAARETGMPGLEKIGGKKKSPPKKRKSVRDFLEERLGPR